MLICAVCKRSFLLMNSLILCHISNLNLKSLPSSLSLDVPLLNTLFISHSLFCVYSTRPDLSFPPFSFCNIADLGSPLLVFLCSSSSSILAEMEISTNLGVRGLAFTNTHLHTHTHGCTVCAVKALLPPTVCVHLFCFPICSCVSLCLCVV